MGCLCLMGPAATLQSADWRGCFPKWVLPRSKSIYFSDLKKWKCCGTEFDINYIACSLLLSKMGAATLYLNGSTLEQSSISTGMLEIMREKLSNSMGPVQLQIGVAIV